VEVFFPFIQKEAQMNRERGLKVVLLLVGLLFVAGVYPAIAGILHTDQSDTGDTMMMSLYATLGVFLLLALRNPSAHRSLIAFAAWSSFAHAAVMSAMGLKIASERGGFLTGSAILVLIGIALIALAPQNRQQSPDHETTLGASQAESGSKR
jgi:hypothetical protein